MTESIVRETLREVRDSVPVPLVDHDAFAARTRRLRRRRRTFQAFGASAAVALAAGAALVVPGLLSEPHSIVAATVHEAGVPVVLDGEIRLVDADGTLTATGHAGTPIGVVAGQLVWLEAGTLTGPDDLRAEGVRAAYVDEAGVSYQDADGTIHLSGNRAPVPSTATLVGASSTAYVTEQAGVLTLRTASTSHVLETGSDGSSAPATAVEVGADTVMVAAGDVVSFFGHDGSRRSGFLGGVTGALSPDGATYAYAADERERSRGMRPGLTLTDTASTQSERVRLTGDAVDLAWVGSDLVVLTEQDGTRTLFECRGTSCRVLLQDNTGTLTLR